MASSQWRRADQAAGDKNSITFSTGAHGPLSNPNRSIDSGICKQVGRAVDGVAKARGTGIAVNRRR